MDRKILKKLEQLKAKLQEQCENCRGVGCGHCAARFDFYEKYASADIPMKYWDLKLSDIQATEGVNLVRKYIKKLDEAYDSGTGLFIWGKNGNGKTLSACSIGKAALHKGYSVRFTFLGQIIAASFDTMYDSFQRQKLQEDILNVDFLIIDDIDKAYIAENSRAVPAIIDSLFRQRVQNCRPVIITSNKQLNEIQSSNSEVFSNSLTSLFKESVLSVGFIGDDKRDDLRKEAIVKFFKDN